MNLEAIYNGRILLVDLAAGECEEAYLDEALMAERIGGASINMALYDKYRDRDPVVIGTGPLTATFAPASCLAVATGRSPLSGAVGHVPLTWLFGAELKLSGFDFAVIMGEAEEPVHLWLHDEIADIEPAGDVWGKGVWEAVDQIRFEHGDEAVQILTIGKAAEQGHAVAALSENYWGSADKIGLGARLGRMRLKAVAARGLGSLDVADGFFEHCTGLRSTLFGDGAQPPADAPGWLSALGAGDELCTAIGPLVQRLNACHACPLPCKIYLMTRADPGSRSETDVDEPGLLASDLSGLIALRRFGAGAPALFERALKLGVNPTVAAVALESEGAAGAEEAGLDRIASQGADLKALGVETIGGVAPWPAEGGKSAVLAQALGVFSNGIPPGPIGSGAIGAPQGSAELAAWWIERQAFAYVLGICPIFVLAALGMTLAAMAGLAARAGEFDDLDEARLTSVARNMIKETIAAGGEIEVSTGLQYEGFAEDLEKLRSMLAL